MINNISTRILLVDLNFLLEVLFSASNLVLNQNKNVPAEAPEWFHCELRPHIQQCQSWLTFSPWWCGCRYLLKGSVPTSTPFATHLDMRGLHSTLPRPRRVTLSLSILRVFNGVSHIHQKSTLVNHNASLVRKSYFHCLKFIHNFSSKVNIRRQGHMQGN